MRHLFILFLTLMSSSAVAKAPSKHILMEVEIINRKIHHRFQIVEHRQDPATQKAKQGTNRKVASIEKNKPSIPKSKYVLVFRDGMRTPLQIPISRGFAASVNSMSTNILWDKTYRQMSKPKTCKEYARIKNLDMSSSVCHEEYESVSQTSALLARLHQKTIQARTHN
jgi:hypothetical protein